MAFSSSDEDTGLAYMHDLGFIPKVKEVDGKQVRGFKVLLGGGLGSQPRHGDLINEFLETDQLIPFIEAVLRIFDRHGERARRNKARMKFLVKEIGIEVFLDLVEKEKKALPFESFPLQFEDQESPSLPNPPRVEVNPAELGLDFELWKLTNVLPQKQDGFVSIGVRVPLGDFYLDQARPLADLVESYAAGEVRFTLRQNILIRDLRADLVPFFYQELKKNQSNSAWLQFSGRHHCLSGYRYLQLGNCQLDGYCGGVGKGFGKGVSTLPAKSGVGHQNLRLHECLWTTQYCSYRVSRHVHASREDGISGAASSTRRRQSRRWQRAICG